MRYTNLQLVQKILASMDGDEVNSCSDTTESRQVLDIVETVFYDIVATGELPGIDNLFQLVPSTDSRTPVMMFRPDDMLDIRWIKYDCQTTEKPKVNYQEVFPLPLHDFMQMVTSFTPTDTNVMSYPIVIGPQVFTLYAKTDHRPKFYTSVDDVRILFDSFDNDVDSTLQAAKTMAFGQKGYVFNSDDNFFGPFDHKQSQRLLHEAKSLAFAELKQSQHVKAEKSAREIKINQQSSKLNIPTQTAYEQVTGMGRRMTNRRIKPTGRY